MFFNNFRSFQSRLGFITANVICLSVLACSSRSPQDFTVQNLSAATAIVEKYGEIKDPSLIKPVEKILARIISHNQITQSPKFSSTQLIVLNEYKPLALTSGGGFIFISHGLLSIVYSDDEKSFIIAHELAHYILGHTEDPIFHGDRSLDMSPTERSDKLQEFEFQADALAISLIENAGFDEVRAIRVFDHPDLNSISDLTSNTHPSIQQRLERINSILLN